MAERLPAEAVVTTNSVVLERQGTLLLWSSGSRVDSDHRLSETLNADTRLGRFLATPVAGEIVRAFVQLPP